MTHVVHTFKLFQLINKYFRNEKDAKSFIAEMDNFVSIKMESGNHNLATKADISRLESATKADIRRLESATRADISHLASATRADISRLASATRADIKRLEAEISGVKTDVGSLKTKIETDISRLEIKMGEGFKDILKWIIALMVAFASLIITSIKLLS